MSFDMVLFVIFILKETRTSQILCLWLNEIVCYMKCSVTVCPVFNLARLYFKYFI